MRTADFDYPLPPGLIAQTPAEPRDHARLLVLRRDTGAIEHHAHFFEIEEELQPGDLLVLNNTRVIPARLLGQRADTGGRVELLLLQRLGPSLWRCLGKPGRGLRPGTPLVIQGNGQLLKARVLERGEGGVRLVEFEEEALLETVGKVPLPPYVHTPLKDPERYQTIYAQIDGSVAAPTAGLHFTPGLLQRLRAKGVGLAFVTLHIGLNSFQPVREEDPAHHTLQTEYWELPAEAAEAVNRAKAAGGRVVAVGTTSVRLLEQAGRASGGLPLEAASGWADLFILPGYRFRAVDAMITNFHLPRSTHLMLVCAFAGRDPSADSGRRLVLQAYQEAVTQGYRFYSFGDGMIVV